MNTAKPNSEPANGDDLARYRAICEAVFAALPNGVSWHDAFKGFQWAIDSVEFNANKHGGFRHFMAQELRKQAIAFTRIGLEQNQPGDKGPSASGARCTELTDQMLNLTNGMAVSEVIGAALNVLDIASTYITPADRTKVAARMIHNAQQIAADGTPLEPVAHANEKPSGPVH